MALSKLVIGLVAGIGSVAVIGGITAGVVASRNNTVVETTSETDGSNSKENTSSEKNESLMKDQSRNDSTNESTTTMKMQNSGAEKTEKRPDKDADMKDAGRSSVTRQEAAVPPSSAAPITSEDGGKGGTAGVEERDPQHPHVVGDNDDGELMESGSGTAGTVQGHPDSDSTQDMQQGHEDPQPQRGPEGEGEPQDL